ncbi:hypothetical protein AAVH_43196 [Aphelenchoides avenae]|nr:hypothetical protein AAVH_43196 [Aphelenchus avenae]
MNRESIVAAFNDYEKRKAWDELFHKINLDSEEREQQLGLSFDESNSIENTEKNRYRNVLPCKKASQFA